MAARKYTKVRFGIWSDPDFRGLSGDARYLYLAMITAPDVSYCGVADWRPGRIADRVGWTAAKVTSTAAELVARRYLVIDENTEEALVRSFIRNDDTLTNPNLSVAMVKAFHLVTSGRIQAVIGVELTRLHEQFPQLAGWGARGVRELLSRTSVSTAGGVAGEGVSGHHEDPALAPREDRPIDPPEALPQALAEGVAKGVAHNVVTGNLVTGNPNPVDQKTSSSGATPKSKAARITADWQPSNADLAWASEKHPTVNVEVETEKFRNHFTAKAGRDAAKLDWSATWKNWIIKAGEFSQQRPTRTSERGPRVYASSRPGYLPQEYS